MLLVIDNFHWTVLVSLLSKRIIRAYFIILELL